MALDDIVGETNEILAEDFTVTTGWSIPTTADVTFDNQGKRIRLISLFVDIRKSTTLVNRLGLVNSARMYKAYIRGVTQIVKARGGHILSFNGDGIVAGFVGHAAENAAILSALNIDWFLHTQLKPRVDSALAYMGVNDVVFNYGMGIDGGDVLVVKAGMKGEDNHDLVWAGNPVNYSVKVGSQASFPHTIYVDDAVFQASHHSLCVVGATFIWEIWHWADKNRYLWRTAWYFGPKYISTVPVDPTKVLSAGSS